MFFPNLSILFLDFPSRIKKQNPTYTLTSSKSSLGNESLKDQKCLSWPPTGKQNGLTPAILSYHIRSYLTSSDLILSFGICVPAIDKSLFIRKTCCKFGPGTVFMQSCIISMACPSANISILDLHCRIVFQHVQCPVPHFLDFGNTFLGYVAPRCTKTTSTMITKRHTTST